MTPDSLDYALQFAQQCLGNAPVLVIGSGLSMPHGLSGMKDLQRELERSLNAHGLSAHDETELAQLLIYLKTDDLETALTKVNFSDAMTRRVVAITWELIYPQDSLVLEKVVQKRDTLPLSRLLDFLFQSTQTKISVVTTNYDRLVEYASAAAGFHHATGFSYGYLGERQSSPTDFFTAGHLVRIRTVDIWKVHGSLDWFTDPSGTVISLTMKPLNPALCDPVIVTPGVNKYQKSLQEPFRSVLAGADATLANATAYLCLGFGFNDSHIQPKLVERCKKARVPLVVLARTLTDNAKKLLLGGHCQQFLALEQHSSGTMMYSSDNLSGTVLAGSDIWQLEQFLDLAT